MVERSESLFFLSVLVGFLFVSISAETCKMSGPCTCDFAQWKIDLNPLIASMKNSSPVFTSTFTDPSGIFIFNYNPCKPFQAGTHCDNDTDIAVNRIDNEGNCLVIGNQKNVAFKGDTENADGIYLEYSNEKSKSFAKVLLRCSNKNSFSYINEKPENIFAFSLDTLYACKPVNHKLSAGSILLILVMVAVTIYLIGGFLFKHFYLQAQGVEIIPHYTFWSDFPLLVRDGCYYTFRGCQGPSTYEKI